MPEPRAPLLLAGDDLCRPPSPAGAPWPPRPVAGSLASFVILRLAPPGSVRLRASPALDPCLRQPPSPSCSPMPKSIAPCLSSLYFEQRRKMPRSAPVDRASIVSASLPLAPRQGPAPLRQIHRPAKPLYKRAEAQLGEQPSRPVHYSDSARICFFWFCEFPNYREFASFSEIPLMFMHQ